VEAVQHPNADRLRVCQVDTVDGRKEIVCGAPNAERPDHIYAPIGAYVPGWASPWSRSRCAASSQRHAVLGSELEADDGSEASWTAGDLAVGRRRPRPWVWKRSSTSRSPQPSRLAGVAGIARDLAAPGGTLKDLSIAPVPEPSPADRHQGRRRRLPGVHGRLIKGVKNGPSPKWLADG